MKDRKQNTSRMSKLGSMVRQNDFFGESVGFSIEGKSSYGSFSGALCSLAIVVLTVSYAAQRMQVMVAYGDTVL